ncbi:hypothetical protein HWV62_20668 [Athelia sp. TMB]|nr:hypothetical protein HWV62_20668 [Athelia sp. TMB]
MAGKHCAFTASDEDSAGSIAETHGPLSPALIALSYTIDSPSRYNLPLVAESPITTRTQSDDSPRPSGSDFDFDFEACYRQCSQRFAESDGIDAIFASTATPSSAYSASSGASLPSTTTWSQMDSDSGSDYDSWDENAEDDDYYMRGASAPLDEVVAHTEDIASIGVCDTFKPSSMDTDPDMDLDICSDDGNVTDMSENINLEFGNPESIVVDSDSESEDEFLAPKIQVISPEQSVLSLHGSTSCKEEHNICEIDKEVVPALHKVQLPLRNERRSTRKDMDYAEPFDNDYESAPPPRGSTRSQRTKSRPPSKKSARASRAARSKSLMQSPRAPKKATSRRATNAILAGRKQTIRLSYAEWWADKMAIGRSSKGNIYYAKERNRRLKTRLEEHYIKTPGAVWTCFCKQTFDRKPEARRHVRTCHSPPPPCIGVRVSERHLYNLHPDACLVEWINKDGELEHRIGGCGQGVVSRMDAKDRHNQVKPSIHNAPITSGHIRHVANKATENMASPKILSAEELPASEAKWITLKKLKWSDPDGKERIWECAERKTRSSAGVDAVAVLAIIRSKTNAFPLSTVIIEQYRPPIDKFIIGLIDEGETAEKAAIRELEEETGFKADSVIELSPVVVSDPGMTTANMQLAVLSVTMEDKLDISEAKLEPGEFIVTRIVELAKLNEELKAYDKKGFVVDARLSHFASGYDMAQRIAGDAFN